MSDMKAPNAFGGDSDAAVTRRGVISGFAVFGTAMAILEGRAFAQQGASGSFSGSAIALAPQTALSTPEAEQQKAVKIASAMRSGPIQITQDATIAEMYSRQRE